jgi:hypothetical protein
MRQSFCMPRKSGTFLLGLLLLCLSHFLAYSQDQSSIKIGVQVGFSIDGFSEGTIKSTILNKLRSFNDVSIVDSGGFYRLNIQAMELKTKAGQPAGMAFSIIVLSPDTPGFYKTMLSAQGTLNDKQIKFLDEFFTDRYVYATSWLFTGSNSDIANICEEIVNTFNADYLENIRKHLK